MVDPFRYETVSPAQAENLVRFERETGDYAALEAVLRYFHLDWILRLFKGIGFESEELTKKHDHHE